MANALQPQRLFAQELTHLPISHGRAVVLLLALSLLLFLPGFFTLAPMDRDEPRFAQASKQMVESGDPIAIMFQNQARNKKPIGVYWLQAGAVELAQAAGFAEARRAIFVYRLPSLLGAIGTVLLTYWAALAFVGRRAAMIAAALVASTLLLNVEARLAKTDALLALSVVAAMGAFARVWLLRQSPIHLAAIFWTALAFGILLKGPITPLIALLAVLALGFGSRGWGAMSALRPRLGVLWCLLLVAPWLIAIGLRTHGAFFSDSIGGDMLGKVAGAKELHGAPPLSYLAAFWLTGWPLAPFAALSAPFVIKHRRQDNVRMLLAWLVPAWILFELVPTKLPHYVLPLYPALAVLTALALENGALHLRGTWRKAVALLLPLVALLLVGSIIFAAWHFDIVLITPFWASALVVAAIAGAAVVLIFRGALLAILTLAPLLSMAVSIMVFSCVLSTSTFLPFALSSQLASATADARATTKGCTSLDAVTTQYREPSLVFLIGTKLKMGDSAAAAQFLAAAPCRIAFIARGEEPAFSKALAGDAHVTRVAQVRGFNLNRGKWLDIDVFVRDGLQP